MGVGKDISLPLLACLQMRVQWNGTHTQLEGVMPTPRNMSGRRPTDHCCGRTALVLGATSAVGRMSGFTVPGQQEEFVIGMGVRFGSLSHLMFSISCSCANGPYLLLLFLLFLLLLQGCSQEYVVVACEKRCHSNCPNWFS